MFRHPAQIRTQLDGYDFGHLQETLLASVSHQGSGFNPIGFQIPTDALEQERALANPRSADSQPEAVKTGQGSSAAQASQMVLTPTSDGSQSISAKGHATGQVQSDMKTSATSMHLGQLDSKAAQQALQALSELAKASLETLTRQSQMAAKHPDTKKQGKRGSGGSSKEMDGKCLFIVDCC